MTLKKSSKLGIGMLLGAAAGAVAGLFLAPKAGKELRKDAKKLTGEAKKLSQDAMGLAEEYLKKLQKKDPEQIAKIVFGDVTDATKKLTSQAQHDLARELASVKEQYASINKRKYSDAVKSVVSGLKTDGSISPSMLKKLGTYLEKDAKKFISKPVKLVKKALAKKAPGKKKSA